MQTSLHSSSDLLDTLLRGKQFTQKIKANKKLDSQHKHKVTVQASCRKGPVGCTSKTVCTVMLPTVLDRQAVDTKRAIYTNGDLVRVQGICLNSYTHSHHHALRAI